MHSALTTDGASSEDADRLAKLLAWATSNGANITNLSLTLTPTPSNPTLRGAIVTAPLTPGDSIASLPPALILSESVARASPLGRTLAAFLKRHPHRLADLQTTPSAASASAPQRDPYLAGVLVLAAFLASERARGEASFWWPYIASLPDKFGLPLEWPREVRERLLGRSAVAFVVEAREGQLRRGVEVVNDALEEEESRKREKRVKTVGKAARVEMDGGWRIKFEDMLWAYSVVASRAFPRVYGEGESAPTVTDEDDEDGWTDINEKEESHEVCLYPVLDMLNHDRKSRIEWNSVRGPGITFVAQMSYNEGDVIWNNYGPKGNENLLSNYGFVIPNNTEDYFKVALDVDRRDPLHAKRIATLRASPELGLIHLLFLDDTEPRPKFVSSARILVANERELTSIRNGAASVGPRCEVLVLSTLWKLLRQKRMAVPEDADDLDLVGSEEEREWARMARVYKKGQRDILDHHIRLVRSGLNKLFQAASNIPESLTTPCEDGDRFFRAFITLENPLLSDETQEWLSNIQSFGASNEETEEEVGDLDEETALSLLLIWEKRRQTASPWCSFFEKAHKVNDERVLEILGDQEADIREHFSDSVRPILDAVPPSGLEPPEDASIGEDEFLWAASLLDLYGVSVPRIDSVTEFRSGEPDSTRGEVFGVVCDLS
ncbi:hypothetical protein DFJ73DRAFT_806937 [Zopfochytrium polystomum]|nr:hypothetical protein DFJ73DRAFT_806937 [Zopfochytrium polystomum]